MQRNKIGILIRRGLSISEIQNVVKEFPCEPDIKYFENLGYSKRTAQEYFRLIKKNSCKYEDEEHKNIDEYNKNLFVLSNNADLQNIILDTSSLGRKSCRDIIDKSSKVTVLYCIIREFDKILKNEEKSDKIKNPVKRYVDEMLYNKENRFKLVPYKYNDIREADDIIIDYVLEQNLYDRPTILTADKRLALKAKTFGFDYILYWRRDCLEVINDTCKDKTIENSFACDVHAQNENTVTDLVEKKNKENQNSKTTDLTYKVDLTEDDRNIIVKMGAKIIINNDTIEVKKYNFGTKVFIVRNNDIEEIFDCEIAKDFDYIVVMCKVRKYGLVKVSKVLMEDDDVNVSDYECSCINEIYALENIIKDEILNELKDMLLS